MEDKLFLILRIGLGVEHPSDNAIKQLSALTFDDWETIRDMGEKQGVSAIALDGINKLIQNFGKESISPKNAPDQWQMFMLEWMGSMLMIEQANQHQKEVMEDLAKKLKDAGCKVMVMKGQANGIFYPHPNHRSAGDVDIYLFDDYSKGNKVARAAGAVVDEGWYKHSVISYKDETFENHQYFVTTRSGSDGKKMEKELEYELNNATAFLPFSESTVIAPVHWTAMFLTYHSCSHFISEGLRLKQLIDWAMFLQKHQYDVEWTRFYDFCQRYHLRRFADAATSICVNHLGIKITNASIATDSPYAKRILHSALYDDDYVFGSGEGNWHNRWHLVRNLFHYRWKYEEIYEMSPWKKLWYYATGYIFKTE